MVDGDIVVAMGSGGWEAVCRGGCPESDAGEESCVGLSVFPPDGSGGVAYHQRESALSMCEWMQNPEERHLERGVGIHIQSWRVALKKGKKKEEKSYRPLTPPRASTFRAAARFLYREAMPAVMPPERANGLYVVVVGDGVRVPFRRGGVHEHSRLVLPCIPFRVGFRWRL